jgi:geranylgeranyl transferase type-2 subunit beta
MITFLKSCQNEDGGFGGNTGHDSHITNSLYALHVAAMYDAVDEINSDKLA